MTADDFLARHGSDTFRRSEELLPALRSGDCVLHSAPRTEAPVSCRHLLNIYRLRAKHLARFNTSHASELRTDVELLVAELERHAEQSCVMWEFTTAPYYAFGVFELLETQQILGCTGGVDRRLMDEEAWETLWGESDLPP